MASLNMPSSVGYFRMTNEDREAVRGYEVCQNFHGVKNVGGRTQVSQVIQA